MGYKFEKYSIGGGGSGGSCIIDVTELPAEYKDVDVYARFDESTYMTFLQLFQSKGITPDITYYVVDELPTEGKASDFNSLSVVHCYIANNISYLYGDLGSGNMWVTVSAMMAEMAGIPMPDKGFTSDITAETEAGIYVTYKEGEKPVEGAVYRSTTGDSAKMWCVSDKGLTPLSQFFEETTGAQANISVFLVDALPIPMKPPTVSGTTMFLPLYVLQETGIAYFSTEDGMTEVSIGSALGLSDRGWSDDIASETLEGVYADREKGGIAYHTYSNGVWSDYIDREAARDTVEDEIIELEFTVNTLTTENELLDFKINRVEAGDEGSVNFAKYAVLANTETGVELARCLKGDGFTNITIPDGVTSIRDYALYGHQLITDITISDSVLSIGNNAFDECRKLEHITLPTGLTKISDGMLGNCYVLADIAIPAGVTSIGINAFANCIGLTSIVIPDRVVSIGNSAFVYSYLNSITLPLSLTSIGETVFFDCSQLTSIIYKGTKAQWKAITFGRDWDAGTPDYIITCTDGTIAKDGTES